MKFQKHVFHMIFLVTLVLAACGSQGGQVASPEPTSAVAAQPTNAPVPTDALASTPTSTLAVKPTDASLPEPTAEEDTPVEQGGKEAKAESRAESVRIRSADGQEQELPPPQERFLQVGDGVAVDETGRAVVRFADLLSVEVLRDGDLTVRELSVEEQSAAITVLQNGGTLLNDFNPAQEIDRRFTVEADFAVITATGTRFLVVREANTPLEWVLGLDAAEDDLEVQALNDPEPGSPTVKPVPSDLARWIAPIGVPSAGISADMGNVAGWLEKVQSGQPVREFGEIVWPHADVVINTGVLEALPPLGEPFQMGEVTLTLAPEGEYGDSAYALGDCNGDGVQDIVMQDGTLLMDFRTVLSRVRALDVTVINRAGLGGGALRAFNPAYEEVAAEPLDVGPGQGQVLSLRSEQPFHYAELTLSDGCFLGFSLTPPTEDGEPGEPRPAVETLDASDYVRITGITLQDGVYVIDFETIGFEPALPGQHVHFFFDTVPPEEAGVPGNGPWILYGGGSPFTGYTLADRPEYAVQMCILVANPDHSVVAGSGNCYALP